MKCAVTGAFGYSGQYITRRLLDKGETVITLTNSGDRPDPFDGKVRVYPLEFDDEDALIASLRNVNVLFNTYWVRFDGKGFTLAQAVENSSRLFQAAQKAGVGRIVHTSITNPSADSALPYFKGKALVEQALIDTGVSYAILRPAILFGKQDILVNNIAWTLRQFPAFGVCGKDNYHIQPIHVDDFAQLAVEQAYTNENLIVNALGPELFTYRELVNAIGQAIGIQRPFIRMPASFLYLASRVIGLFKNDTVLTMDEIRALTQGLLWADTPATGSTELTEWMNQHSATLGSRYSSELARRRNRSSSYEEL